MRRIPYFLAALSCLAAFDAAWAIDNINPSKDNQPKSFWTSGGGNAFSIFNGDPKRIQRANAVDPKSFDAKLDVTPNPAVIKTMKAVAPNPSFKIMFSIHNHAKKTYTLSFPHRAALGFPHSQLGQHAYLYLFGQLPVRADDRFVDGQ